MGERNAINCASAIELRNSDTEKVDVLYFWRVVWKSPNLRSVKISHANLEQIRQNFQTPKITRYKVYYWYKHTLHIRSSTGDFGWSVAYGEHNIFHGIKNWLKFWFCGFITCTPCLLASSCFGTSFAFNIVNHFFLQLCKLPVLLKKTDEGSVPLMRLRSIS